MVSKEEAKGKKAYIEEDLEKIANKIKSAKDIIKTENQKARTEEEQSERVSEIEILKEKVYIEKKKLELKKRTFTNIDNKLKDKESDINQDIITLSDDIETFNKENGRQTWSEEKFSLIAKTKEEWRNVLRTLSKEKSTVKNEKEESEKEYQRVLKELKIMGGTEKKGSVASVEVK